MAGNVAIQRRSTLFNLYAFDSKHTSALKTPTLVISGCIFSQFLTGTQESLIHVETINLWKLEKDPSVSDGNGNLLKLGTDNGANITIKNSTFSFIRLCKGIIVYRKAPTLIGTGMLDY